MLGCAAEAWALGAFGPVLAVLDDGPNGVQGGHRLALALVAWAALQPATMRRRMGLGWWPLALASITVTVAVSEPLVGRAPAVLGIVGVGLAGQAWSMAEGPGPHGRGRDLSWVGIAAVFAAGLLWLVSGRLPIGGGALVVAAAVLVVEWADPTRLAGIDATVTAAVSRAEGWVGALAALTKRSAANVGRRTVTRAAAGQAGIRSTFRWARAAATLVHAAVAVVFALASAPVWWAIAGPDRQFRGQINDLPEHMLVAHQLRIWPPHSYSPHVLFATLFRTVDSVMPDRWAATVLLAAVYGAIGLVLYAVGRRTWDGRSPLGRRAALVLPAIYLLCESPALLVASGRSWWSRPRFDPIGTAPQLFVLHTWASPTSVLLLPFALVLVVAVVDIVTAADPAAPGPPPRTLSASGLAVLTVLATAAKPPVTLVLLGALPAFGVLRQLHGHPVPWGVLGKGFLLPGAAVCAFQTVFLAEGFSPAEQTTWRWDPFWLVRNAQMYLPVVWVAALLPLLCLLVGRRRYLAQPVISLLLLCCAVSFVPTYLLRETGSHANHGNLGWTMIFSLILLMIFSAHFMALEVRDLLTTGRSGNLPWWPVPLGVLAALSLAAGVYHYLVLLGAAAY